VNRFLFIAAEFLSRPPGFYFVLAAMAACTALVPLGMTEVVTYALSVAAIVITGVLIQGFRDTAAIHAKLDEIVVALNETRNEVVGLEHSDPKEIEAEIERIEKRAEAAPSLPSADQDSGGGRRQSTTERAQTAKAQKDPGRKTVRRTGEANARESTAAGGKRKRATTKA
jgi:low affinity Fe/Cu permease